MDAWRPGTVLRAALGLAIGLCASASLAQPIRIGWLSSLTGPLSSPALAENQGVQMCAGTR